MRVGFLIIKAYLPGITSLKGKRSVVRSLTSQLRNNFNISVAEIGSQDLWQSLELGIACISNNGSKANEILSSVLKFLQEQRDIVLIDYRLELI